MIGFPKDKPVKDPEFMAELNRVVARCEFPGGCRMRVRLDVHHIKGRGLGGGSRKDTEDNLIVLCREHHTEAHSKGVPFRPELVAAISRRTDFEQRQIRSFFRNR